MKRLLTLYAMLVILLNISAQQVQKPSCGEIIHMQDFPSKFIEPRNVDIWLPEHYNSANQYAVLYMHDGQMLFDPNATWNKQSWDVDDISCKLIDKNEISDFIIVAIWSPGDKRHQNYFPQKPFERLSAVEKDSIVKQLQNAGRTKDTFHPDSDNYLNFIVTELKPFIDNNYSVYTDQGHTFMAGSSMGGLISIYAICEYPDVIGGVACLSTHWPGTFSAVNPFPDSFFQYLDKHLPDPKNHQIYFDYGDQTLDALYPPFQKKVDEMMARKGYDHDNWQSLFFEGKDHSENSWKERFEIPLLFLLGK
jgi:predicted alpha/beta superfamily hydrolase